MRQVTKTILLMAAVGLGCLQTARAFSLAGPVGNGGDSWQIAPNGWGPPRDVIAAKNLGEEYRRNTPVMFYTYDQNFRDFYGAAGMASVDKAFTILNESFTNSPSGPIRGVDGYSTDLSEFSLETRHVNYQAQALGIIDMSSYALGNMVAELGLADSVFYTWGIHNRYLPAGGTCPPDMEYTVVQRNFDFVSSPLDQLQYSAYVNNVKYYYEIEEFCTGPNPLAEPAILSVDVLADIASPVSTYQHNNIWWGDYFSGLTRDDVAGFRYLLSTNNVNYEDISPDSTLYQTTTNIVYPPLIFPPYLTGATNFSGTNGTGYYFYSGVGTNFGGTATAGYGYGDYTAFLAFIRTNPPAAVQAAYPGVVITSVSNTYVLATNQTIVTYFTNGGYGSPAGTQIFVIATNWGSEYWEFLYDYTFANVFPYHSAPSYNLLVTATVGTGIGSPVGSPAYTNYTTKKIKTTSADFFVLPLFYTNTCPLDLLLANGSIPNVLAITNGIGMALTNSAETNLLAMTYLVSFFTNYSYQAEPVNCTAITGATNYFQGIEKMQFVYVPYTNFNTLSGLFYQPITNNYTLISVNAGVPQVQYLQRIVTAPDFLMSAADLLPSGNSVVMQVVNEKSLPNFDTAHVLPNLAGPGTIQSPSEITWNKSSTLFYNTPSGTMNGDPYFNVLPGNDASDGFYSTYYVVGSFDGTTNAPVVFPDGTSIDDLANQVLITVSPQSLANGAVNQPYPPVQFTVSGGALTGALTWSGNNLPANMTITPAGIFSGVPTVAGTYSFSVTVTDSTGLSVQYYYILIIQ